MSAMSLTNHVYYLQPEFCFFFYGLIKPQGNLPAFRPFPVIFIQPAGLVEEFGNGAFFNLERNFLINFYSYVVSHQLNFNH